MPKQELVDTNQAGLPAEVPVRSESNEMLGMMIEAAKSPEIDTDKMQQLIQMRKDAEEYEAEKAFWAAFPAMQKAFPSIPKKGSGYNNSEYGRMEDIKEKISPIMGEHGFSLTYRHKDEDGIITTTGLLAHNRGHVERDEFVGKPDTTGSKNEIQARGSTRSYGERYVCKSLLGLAFEDDPDEDDGGKPAKKEPAKKKAPAGKKPADKKPATGGTGLATDFQVKDMRKQAEDRGLNEAEIAGQFDADSFEKIKMGDVNAVVDLIKMN